MQVFKMYTISPSYLHKLSCCFKLVCYLLLLLYQVPSFIACIQNWHQIKTMSVSLYQKQENDKKILIHFIIFKEYKVYGGENYPDGDKCN